MESVKLYSMIIIKDVNNPIGDTRSILIFYSGLQNNVPIGERGTLFLKKAYPYKPGHIYDNGYNSSVADRPDKFRKVHPHSVI
jgi:hypothetical protein